MQPFVAKRKRKENIDLSRDYFIFGFYPPEAVIFPHPNRLQFDASTRSCYLRTQSKLQIVSHLHLINHQANNQIYVCVTFFGGEGQFTNLDEKYVPKEEKELYLNELIEVKFIPTDQLLTINDNKLSSFSIKSDILTLNSNQKWHASELLNCLKQKRYGTLDISNLLKRRTDLNVIPAVISHVSAYNNFDGPFLVVVKSQDFIDELFDLFNSWTYFRTLVMLGNEDQINTMQKVVFPLAIGNTTSSKFHVVLTTKEIFKKNNVFFYSIPWIIALIMTERFTHIDSLRKSCHYGLNLTGVSKNTILTE